MQPVFAAVDRFNEKLRPSGTWVFAGGLDADRARRPPSTPPASEPVVTDGPYAEAKE